MSICAHLWIGSLHGRRHSILAPDTRAPHDVAAVKQVMVQDFCTWDDDYNSIVSDIRRKLADLAGGRRR